MVIDLTDIELIQPLNDGDDQSAPEGVDPVLWAKWLNEDEVKHDKFLWELRRGIAGQNIGLANGLKAVNGAIYGTHKARYYLEGGESGSFKTTTVDFKYVFSAWQDAKAKGKPIKIIYFSFEIGKTQKLFRWASYFIFQKYGLSLPSDYLQGRINGKLLTKQHANMTLVAYTEIQAMMKDIIVIEDVFHPTKMFDVLVEGHFAKHGKVERAVVTAAELKSNPNKKGHITGYTENDPNLVTIIIKDHLALAGSEMGLDTKGVMDKDSKYSIVLRNMFQATVVIIQQFSTDMMGAYRSAFNKKTESSITPSRLDFGDSKAPFRDADVVMGYVKPQAQFPTFEGFDLLPANAGGLGDCFVASYLMKNRYGPANFMFPLFINAIAGTVYDLPTNANPFEMEEWTNKAAELFAVSLSFKPLI